jgi:hypothetical protein
MKRWIKILLIGLSTPIIIFILLVAIYIVMNWQGVIEPYQVGNPNASMKVLIASQGSEFKEDLSRKIIKKLENDSIYISVIDCTTLKKENAEDWQAILIMHTTKAHKIPRYVSTFLEGLSDYSNLVLISTSGGGDEVITEFEVDAISTASSRSLTDTITGLAISKINNILYKDLN